MKTLTLSTRIDEPTKLAFTQICQDIGLSTSQALQIFAKAVVNHNGIPFELKASKPNTDTISAMRELDELTTQAKSNTKENQVANFAELLTDMDITEQDKSVVLAGLS